MTAATRVCCSMISETQTQYGSRVLRQGRSRRLFPYQARSAPRKLARPRASIRALRFMGTTDCNSSALDPHSFVLSGLPLLKAVCFLCVLCVCVLCVCVLCG